jgi:hypothetical protein
VGQTWEGARAQPAGPPEGHGESIERYTYRHLSWHTDRFVSVLHDPIWGRSAATRRTG